MTTENMNMRSKTEERFIQNLADLPDEFPLRREQTERERFMNHTAALRYRLDSLVHAEEQFGEDQRRPDRSRAERNALIWVLGQLNSSAEFVLKPVGRTEKKPSQTYVRIQMEAFADLAAGRFNRINERKPGFVFHESGDDVAPIEVSLSLWFYLRGRIDGMAIRQTPQL